MRKALFAYLFISAIVAQTVDYDTQIQPLWNANCTSCHGNSGGLNLSAAQSFDNLVDINLDFTDSNEVLKSIATISVLGTIHSLTLFSERSKAFCNISTSILCS